MKVSIEQKNLIFEYIYGGIPIDKEWGISTIQYKRKLDEVIYYSDKLKYYFKEGNNILIDNGLFVEIEIKDKVIIPVFEKYYDKELLHNTRLYDIDLNKLDVKKTK